jgi:hypothetical protein
MQRLHRLRPVGSERLNPIGLLDPVARTGDLALVPLVFGYCADLIAALLTADIWCGEVKTHLEAVADPQVRHLGLIASYDHPSAGPVRVVGPAVRLGETPAAIRRPAPLVGQHSREILAELGRDEAAIDRLVAAGIVGVPPAAGGRGPAD